jgi:hypothetical protein
MTARFLAGYQTPAEPDTFDRHYRDVHLRPTSSRFLLTSYR